MRNDFLIYLTGFLRTMEWALIAWVLMRYAFPIAALGAGISAVNSVVFTFIQQGADLGVVPTALLSMTTTLGAGLILYGLVRRLRK